MCFVRLIDMGVDGFSTTVFCYGQTGSGKTHTLTGPPYLVSTQHACLSRRGVGLCAVFVSGESDSAWCDTAMSPLFREYLRENESSSKTMLACNPAEPEALFCLRFS